MKVNLYHTLENILKENNRNIDDITYVGTKQIKLNLNKVLTTLKNTNYDAKSPMYIPCDFIIKGNDFLVIREEFYGTSWWQFIQTNPKLPTTESDFQTLITNHPVEFFENLNTIDGKNSQKTTDITTYYYD